jgi:hypothetical protein
MSYPYYIFNTNLRWFADNQPLPAASFQAKNLSKNVIKFKTGYDTFQNIVNWLSKEVSVEFSSNYGIIK